MTKNHYEKLKDIENFYKKKSAYQKLMRKRRRRTVMILLVFIIILVSGILVYRHYSSNKYSTFLYNNKGVKINNSKLLKNIDSINNSFKIEEINYKWGDNLEEYNSPKRLIIHHSVSRNVSPETIHKWHLDKDYGGIGYNYYIKKDGTIYKGRDEKMKGAHTLYENGKSIGICLDGNFEEDTIGKDQLESLINIGTSLVIKYNLEDVVGHRDCNETKCPGENIDIYSIKNSIASKLEKIAEELE